MKYIALLRGINIGGRNKVEMFRLRETFEKLGFYNVSTWINSGNIIFESDEKVSIESVENTLLEEFGFSIPLVTRDVENIKNICFHTMGTVETQEKQSIYVLFLWDEYNNKNSLDLVIKNEVDRVEYIDGALIRYFNNTDYKKSGINKLANSVLNKKVTVRNINTVRKLKELF